MLSIDKIRMKGRLESGVFIKFVNFVCYDGMCDELASLLRSQGRNVDRKIHLERG